MYFGSFSEAAVLLVSAWACGGQADVQLTGFEHSYADSSRCRWESSSSLRHELSDQGSLEYVGMVTKPVNPLRTVPDKAFCIQIVVFKRQ